MLTKTPTTELKGKELLKEDDVILVTGGTGLFGNGIKTVVSNAKLLGKWVYLSSKDCDLSNYQETEKLFNKLKPTYVIHLAAYVGGLFRNMNADERLNFWLKNVNMNNNVLTLSNKFKVKKCVSPLSTCVYPDKVKCPFDESVLFDGPPHPSNEPYSYAKRCLALYSKWLNEIPSVKTEYICCIPCNLYGPHDNFNIQDSHVLPGLMHKIYLAMKNNTDFTIWGTGKPLRQFVYSVDAAEMLLLLMLNYKDCQKDCMIAIVANEEDEISIKDGAIAIKDAFKFKGKLVYDTSKSDGQFKKTALNTKFKKLFPDFKFTPFKQGIEQTVKWFLDNYDTQVRK